MKRFDSRIVFGLMLIVGGGLALAQALGYLENVPQYFWGAVFVIAGLAFLTVMFSGQWWGAFPTFTFLSLGALILLPESFEDIGGGLFLGGIALSFWYVYFTDRAGRWWALIPSGVLSTLAVVTIVAEQVGEFQTAGVFFFGLAITFLLVALLAKMKWAYYPAIVLGVMGILGVASLLDIANYVWAVALILVGGVMLFRYFTNRT